MKIYTTIRKVKQRSSTTVRQRIVHSYCRQIWQINDSLWIDKNTKLEIKKLQTLTKPGIYLLCKTEQKTANGFYGKYKDQVKSVQSSIVKIRVKWYRIKFRLLKTKAFHSFTGLSNVVLKQSKGPHIFLLVCVPYMTSHTKEPWIQNVSNRNYTQNSQIETYFLRFSFVGVVR